MKTIKILASVTLLIISTSAFANTTKDRNRSNSISKEIAGSPEDINIKDVEALKELGSSTVIYPTIVLSAADDFDKEDIEALKEIEYSGSLPDKVAGTPDDININDIEALKTL